jgi:AraC family transcriptional regulator, regulatory protein of adaptative response / DNA-3-methyladenine glycosylase II
VIETDDPRLTRLSPTAARLAEATTSEIAALGVPAKRADCIHRVASDVAGGKIDLGPAAQPEAVVARLRELPGIGPWTADYVALRALRWPDAFPAGDLGIRRALGGISQREAAHVSERWRPWRAYAVMHLWAQLEPQREEEAPDA